MKAVVDLLTGNDFLYGALAGFAGAGLITLFRRKKLDWGIVWGTAVVAGLAVAGRFGWLAIGRMFSDQPWAVPAALLAAAAAAAGISRIRTEPVGGLAVAVSIAGIWATVPDTERIAVVVGVTAILMWVWWPTMLSVPRLPGSIITALLAAWAATLGGLPRATGLIGGLAAIASLGLSAAFLPRARPWTWLGAHTIIVLIWSRWAGLMDSVALALLTGVAATAAVIAIAVVQDRHRQGAKTDPVDRAV